MMIKRMLLFALVLIVLVAQVQPVTLVLAEPTAELFAAPSQAMPGAEVEFSGYGFTPVSEVTLYLLTTDGIDLGTFWTDANGGLNASVTLPAVDPATYDVMAAPNDIFTSLTILAPLGVDILPNSGPPGTIVHFVVSNLRAGQLRLDYDGAPVFGPVEVAAGTYEDDFLVPADRPVPLGTDAELKAVNLSGSQVLGAASTFFVSQEPNPTPYTITEIQLPIDPVAPGSMFTVSGVISPPPVGPLSNYALKVLWKAASGKVVPITVGTPVLLPDGSFSATAHAPSLLAGDPLIPETDDQVGVAFFDLDNGPHSVVGGAVWGIEPPPPVFRVKVEDTNGAPIQNAIVDVRAFSIGAKKLNGETTGGQVMNNQLSNLIIHPNQITSYLGALDPSESDPFTCQSTPVYGRTDANGIFEVKIDPAALAMMGEKIFLGNLPKPTYMDVPLEIKFPLYVNALHTGFGEMDGTQPVPFTMNIRFSGVTNRFYNADTNLLLQTDPLVVKLPALPGGTNVTIPIVPKVKVLKPATAVIGGFKNYLGTGIPMTAFGNFYSFPLAGFPDDWFVHDPANLEIEFQHDPGIFGELDESNITFTLSGETYPFINKGPKYSSPGECDAIVYRASIPNPYRLAPGNYTGMIELHDLSSPVNITKHYIQLNVVPAPTWIQDAKYKRREIYNSGGSIAIWGYQFPTGEPNSNSSLDTNVNKVGLLENQVTFEDEVVEYLYPDHTSGVTYRSVIDSTVLNEGVWPPKKFNESVAGGKEILIPSQTVTVLDTGKIPLYRHVFGIKPIAGATLGADMWFDATLTTGGKIQFLSSGGTSTSLLVTPQATVGVDAFFDLSIIFGLVSANAHAIPDITLKMPANFVDGNLEDSTKCFIYNLDITWSAKAGVCPFCLKKSGKENIFHGSNPSPCTVPQGPAAQISTSLTVETPEPPTASPALAVDGFGHTLMVWSDENNNIQSRLLSGSQIVANVQVSNNNASVDPQVAFYAPNKAVAAWTESSLTQTEAMTATLDQITQAQHLKFATWNGTSWGAAQNLTLPADSNGDGRLALAGCMSTNPACPAGGAVTAVWVRNAGSSLEAREFRLFYASYTGGTWSIPQEMDPASTGTDAEASVAYSNSGNAVAAWVRDGDRNLATLNDRLIAHRQLTSGAPVVVESGLPAGSAEPSMVLNSAGEMVLAYTVATDTQAFIGSQRQLHAAKQTCGEGGCTWTDQALIDSNGRAVHAESPALTLNASGQAQITYRALGFGGSTVLPGDALGTILGTGEIAQTYVNFSSNIVSPSYLTQGGSTQWQVTAAFDPLLNQVYAASSQGSGPVLPMQAVNLLKAQGYDMAGLAAEVEPLAFVAASALPDFSIFDVSLSTLYPQDGGDPLVATVFLLNNGPEFSGSLEVKLTWDAPFGLGAPAGGYSLASIAAGELTGIEFSTEFGSLSLPAFPHLPHKLYVQVNPGQDPPESNYQNNTKILVVGGLPAPEGLEGVAQAGDSSVFLSWLPVEHLEVHGYRIYRSSDGRIFEPVGSSFDPNFVDLSGVLGETYLYAVTAYAGDGFESPLSASMQAVVGNLFPVYLPLVRR